MNARLDVLDALVAATADVPALVEIVTTARSRPDAVARLRERFAISEAGADAVLSTQLYRLMPLYREHLVAERDLTQSDSSNERGSAGG